MQPLDDRRPSAKAVSHRLIWRSCAVVQAPVQGAGDGAMASVDVLSGLERRPRGSVEKKKAIVAAAFEPGAAV